MILKKRDKKFEHEITKIFQDGSVICREGDLTREMFVIRSGVVEVSKNLAEKEVVLARLYRGDFFGEMSLLESEPRSATVRAVGEVTVNVIHTGGFLLKIRRDPTFAFEMLQRLSGRIRTSNEKIIELTNTLDQGGVISSSDLEKILDGKS